MSQTTTNKSGLRPLGHAVLVRPYEPERRNSLIALPAQVEANLQTADQRAVVIEVGPECWTDEKKPRAIPGDKVMIAKWAGTMIIGPKDNKQYRVINSADVYCALED